MFDIKKEVLETHEARLTVQVEDETAKKAMQEVARSISREYNIPGFRRGKAPYSRVLHYVGEDAIRQRAVDAILEKDYAQIIEQAEIAPYGPGELEDLQLSPIGFTIRVPLEPEVTLGDYQSLRAEWQEAAVTDEEMVNIVEQIREENAMLEPLDRPAQFGDEVHVDVVGTANEEVFVEEEDIAVRLDENEPFIASGFVEALIGMNVGEEKSFTVVLPEHLDQETLRGAEAKFDVKVVGVYERILPDFDDALASTVGSFETAEALRQDIYDRLLESKSSRSLSDYEDQLLDSVVTQSEVRYPPAAVQHTLDDLVEETSRRINRERNMSLEDALQLDGMTLEQLRARYTPRAEANLRRSLVIFALARDLGIKVTDDEVIQEYNDLFTQFGITDPLPENRLDLASDTANSLRTNLFARKALEQLVKIGRGQADAEETQAEVVSEEPVESDETVDALAKAPDEASTTEAPEETSGEVSEEAKKDDEA